MGLGVDYIETSAKESYNIHKVFNMLSNALVDEHDSRHEKNGGGASTTESTFVFNSQPVNPQSGGDGKCRPCW